MLNTFKVGQLVLATALAMVTRRIRLGFSVLLATFVGVSAYTLFRIDEQGRELRFVRAAYWTGIALVIQSR